MSNHKNHKVILFIFLIVFTVFVLFDPLQSLFGFKNPQCPIVPNQILTVIPGGRLGNNIWEYMSLISFQNVYFNNGTIFLHRSTKRELQDLFYRIDNPIISHLPKACIQGTFQKTIDLMEEPKFFNFSQNNLLVTLDVYSCRFTDMLQYGFENIRRKLRFHQIWIDKGTNVLKNIKATFGYNETDVTFIGVHYRGGDYNIILRREYGEKFEGSPSYLYYRNAMKYFEATTKNPIFVFITIDHAWVALNFRYLQDFKIYKHHPVGASEDLVLLSLCNHSVINYGTYGAAAAFFANGITFVYDLKLPNDGRGYTLVNNMAKVVPNWFLCDDSNPCNTSRRN